MLEPLYVGAKIVFRDTPHNREILGWPDEECGFQFDTAYEIYGQRNGQFYFIDGAGYDNFAGCDRDGSSGIYEIIKDW